MNEYTIYYLNGIIAYLMAEDWKDSIIEAKFHAERKLFNNAIKYIVDEDGVVIKNININTLEFNYSQTQVYESKN